MRDEVVVVGSASSGDDAPELARRVAPDVVLMDYRMPGLNGAEATGFYERLTTATELPTTSQPTPADFLAVYEELAPRYERVLSLQISSTLSGTFASAQSAAELLGGDKVRVIDTRTVAAALALL